MRRPSLSAPSSPKKNGPKNNNDKPKPLKLKDTKSKISARLSKWLKAMDQRLADLEKQGKWKPIKKTNTFNGKNKMLTPTDDYLETNTVNKKRKSIRQVYSNNIYYNHNTNNDVNSKTNIKSNNSYENSLDQLKRFNQYWESNSNDDTQYIDDDNIHELVPIKRNNKPRKSLSTPVSPKNTKFGRGKRYDVIPMENLSPVQPYTIEPKTYIIYYIYCILYTYIYTCINNIEFRVKYIRIIIYKLKII